MSNHTVIVLHGAGTGSWMWERVTTAMTSPALALSVPGRVEGATPDGCATQLVADIDAGHLVMLSRPGAPGDAGEAQALFANVHESDDLDD